VLHNRAAGQFELNIRRTENTWKFSRVVRRVSSYLTLRGYEFLWNKAVVKFQLDHQVYGITTLNTRLVIVQNSI